MKRPDFGSAGIIFLFLSIALTTLGQGAVGRAIAEEGMAMKKIVMVLPESNFRDEELFEPKKIFEEHGMKVTTACTNTERAKGTLGATVKPDMAVADIKVQDFDAIVLVGGEGASQYWDDPLVHKLVREAARSNKVVAAICIAPLTLARAGVLTGKRATIWYSEGDKIKAGGAIYTGTGVERDGRVITASGPDHAGEFAGEILKALAQ